LDEKKVTRQTYYYDHLGQLETMQQLTDAYSSGVVELQYEQNFLQEHFQIKRE
jgi:hypothetical protein